MKDAFRVGALPIGALSPAPEWKPLNKGYEGFLELFSEYARTSSSPHSPALSRGLRAYLAEPAARILRTLGPKPVCLIEGISCPWNGTSLRRFLSLIGLEEPDIHAIDILDIEVVARLLGCDLPDLRFEVGDAARLERWADGSVQLLVQDHLVNCAPHGVHRAIVREAARLLDRDGVWMLNFSVEPLLDSGRQLSFATAERVLGRPLSETAYSLREAGIDEGRLFASVHDLLGAMITQEETGRSIFVTPPHGNFEFYFPLAELERLLADVELRIVFQSCEEGVDQHGNHYQRHRTLVKHALQ